MHILPLCIFFFFAMQSSIDPYTFLNHNFFFFLEDWEVIKVKSMDDFLPLSATPKSKGKNGK